MDDTRKYIRKALNEKDVLYAKVPNELYRAIYKVSMETGFTMSVIIKMCCELALPEVTRKIKRIKEGNLD